MRTLAHPAHHPYDTAIAVEAAVRADISHGWTLSELAAIAHLSPSGLGQLFTKVHGVSPFTWITHQRVREMARLLRETCQPVRDIARAVGWANQAHATQQFRKLTGRSPTEYRAEVREVAVMVCLWRGHPIDGRDGGGSLRCSVCLGHAPLLTRRR